MLSFPLWWLHTFQESARARLLCATRSLPTPARTVSLLSSLRARFSWLRWSSIHGSVLGCFFWSSCPYDYRSLENRECHLFICDPPVPHIASIIWPQSVLHDWRDRGKKEGSSFQTLYWIYTERQVLCLLIFANRKRNILDYHWEMNLRDDENWLWSHDQSADLSTEAFWECVLLSPVEWFQTDFFRNWHIFLLLAETVTCCSLFICNYKYGSFWFYLNTLEFLWCSSWGYWK